MTVTQALAIGVPIAAPLVGFFVWWHRNQTAQTTTLGEQSAAIAELRVALIGLDGQNGMRGEVRAQAARMEELGGIVRHNSEVVQTHVRVADEALRIAKHAAEVADVVAADFEAHVRTHDLPATLRPTLYDRRRAP